MLKALKFLCLVVACISIQSCDKDEHDDPVMPTVSTVDVFPNGMPKSVQGMTLTVNEMKQLIQIEGQNEVYSFEYGEASRGAEKYDVVMHYRDLANPAEDYDVYFRLNDAGFASSAVQYWKDQGETYEYRFEYNAEGQPTFISSTETDEDYYISYSKGNIASIAYHELANAQMYEKIYYYYTNSQFPALVPNKGSIMLFEAFYDIDLEYVEMAYYAGILGKATADLPMGYGDDKEVFEEFAWEFNENGLPVEFDADIKFTW